MINEIRWKPEAVGKGFGRPSLSEDGDASGARDDSQHESNLLIEVTPYVTQPNAIPGRYFGCGMMFTIRYPSLWMRK